MNGALTRRAVHLLFGQVRGGTLEVVDRAGSHRFGHARPHRAPIDARLTVHDPRFYGRLLREGSVGLGESYADGWWDADDLTAALRLALRSMSRTFPVRDSVHRAAKPLIDLLTRRRRPDHRRDRRNIRAHYDLGNELFRRFLDDTMMYSCAIFESPAATLEQASLAKLDRLAQRLELTSGDRVLEIGTGWGGFALHAASRYGCHVTTTTISDAQYEHARRRVADAGLTDRVTVLCADYRELDATFDKVVAIEMIEAVDWREYDTFFARCRALVADDGLVVMQAIVVPDKSFERVKHHTDFIKAAIFPGGCLPSLGALSAAATRNELTLTRRDSIGPHYAETLRRWRANLHEARDELAQLGYDDRFVRLWDFYFSYCEAGFEERYLDDVQLVFVPSLPAQESTHAPISSPDPVPVDIGSGVRLPRRPRALRRVGPGHAPVRAGPFR